MSQFKTICKKYKFKEIAEEYLISKKAYVFSINTMLTKSSNSKHDVFNLHRDADSINSVTFFIYWTTTNQNNGSTSLILVVTSIILMKIWKNIRT